MAVISFTHSSCRNSYGWISEFKKCISRNESSMDSALETSQQWMIWCVAFVYLWFCCMNIAPPCCYIWWISGPSALGKFCQNYEVIVAVNFVSPCTAHSIGQQLMFAYINYILHHILWFYTALFVAMFL